MQIFSVAHSSVPGQCTCDCTQSTAASKVTTRVDKAESRGGMVKNPAPKGGPKELYWIRGGDEAAQRTAPQDARFGGRVSPDQVLPPDARQFAECGPWWAFRAGNVFACLLHLFRHVASTGLPAWVF